LGSPSIPSSFAIPSVHKVFDENGNLINGSYDKRVGKFLNEFEWYVNALTNQISKSSLY
jgi:hypothetical protein